MDIDDEPLYTLEELLKALYITAYYLDKLDGFEESLKGTRVDQERYALRSGCLGAKQSH